VSSEWSGGGSCTEGQDETDDGSTSDSKYQGNLLMEVGEPGRIRTPFLTRRGPRAAQSRSICMPIIYHMVQKSLWDETVEKKEAYQPPTYDQDGFIHLSSDSSLLIEIGNNFYKGVIGEFELLCIDTELLPDGQLRYEPAAPVGNMPAHSTGHSEPLFPHLYGLLEPSCVTRVCKIHRSSDGDFLSIEL
jgi:uncharacterized protein (DUF952 family)